MLVYWTGDELYWPATTVHGSPGCWVQAVSFWKCNFASSGSFLHSWTTGSQIFTFKQSCRSCLFYLDGCFFWHQYCPALGNKSLHSASLNIPFSHGTILSLVSLFTSSLGRLCCTELTMSVSQFCLLFTPVVRLYLRGSKEMVSTNFNNLWPQLHF